MAEDDLTRQSSGGSDETNDYPEGLPGTTPPDDNRFMKRMKALDRKAGHGRKASPNESKRREMREGSGAYLLGHVSPIREMEVVEQFPAAEKHGRVEEAGGSVPSEKPSSTPSREGSEKALKKHVSVPARDGSTEEVGDKASVARRSTMPSGTPRGRSRKEKWRSKVTRDSHREVKRRPFEAEAGGDAPADDTGAEGLSVDGEERVKKLSKSESTGEPASVLLSSGEDVDEEMDSIPDKEGVRKKQVQFCKTRRSTVAVPHHHTNMALQEIEQKRRRGGHAPREGSIAKEKKEFYSHLKLAIVSYGIGALAKLRHVPPTSHSRQYNRHASEGSVHGHMMSEQLWVLLNRYLEGYSNDEEKLAEYQSQILGRRQEVRGLLSKILSFQLPLLEQQDSTYEFGGDSASGTGEYTEIPSSDERTPHMSLDLAQENVTSHEGDPPAEGNSSSSSLAQVEEATHHHRPVPHLSINDDPTSSLTPSAIQRLQLSKSSKPSSFDEPTASFPPKSFLDRRQIVALQRVTSLLDRLEQAERLYPTMRALGDENPEYRRPNFCRKVEALQLWSKITEGLSHRLSHLSTWFGIRISNPRDDDLFSMERAFSSDSGTPCSSSSYTPTVQSCAVLPSSQALSPAGGEERRHVGIVSPANSGKVTTRVVKVGRYHRFVVLALKKGIKRMMDSISAHNDCVLRLSLFALAGERSHGRWIEDDEGEREERIPIHPSRSSSDIEAGEGHFVNWLAEFDKMNLPMFHDQFLLLARVRLDVIHECLRLQLYLRPPKTPSEFSISRLVTECGDTLKWALWVKEEFAEMIEQAVRGNVLQGGHLDAVCGSFESDLTEVFDLYLDYLQDWVKMSAAYNVLSKEWPTVKDLSRKMKGREATAARRFCLMATQMLWQSNEFVQLNMDQLVEKLNAAEITTDHSARRIMVEMSRLFKNLFTDSKENSSKVLGFAKALLKDLEVAADLHVDMSHKELLQSLHSSDHAQVAITGRMDRGKMMFVPLQLARALDNKEGIAELLTLAFGRDDIMERFPQLSPIRDHLYILIVNVDHDAPQVVWPGDVIHVETSIEATITSMELEVEGMKLVVWNSSLLDRCRRSVHKALGRVKDVELHTSSHQEVTQCLEDIREGAVKLCRTNLELYDEVQRQWNNVWELPEREESDTSPYHSMIQACFNFGFENVRETIRLLGENLAYKELGPCFLNYAIKWMDFIIQKCRKGRGTRPRWATAGLDYLMVGCHPKVLATLGREQFEETKRKVNQCLSHVVGENPQKPPPKKRGHAHVPFTIHGSPTLPRQRRGESNILEISLPARSLSDHPPEDEGEAQWFLGGLGMSTGSLRPPLPQLEEDYTSNFPPLAGVTKKTPPSTDSSASTSSGVVKDSPPESSGYDDTAPLFMSLLPPDVLPYRSVSANAVLPHSPDTSTGEAPDGVCRVERIRRAAIECDKKRDCKLKENSIIGRAREKGICAADAMRLSTLKQVEFTWIRGRLLGKGSSGKVYEAMNVKTGETMAVKQIPIQENNQRVVQRIVDEIANLQKLKHTNIIRYYGVEVHRSELFLFMEYCPEGNVWSLAQQGLPEALVRRYTYQILLGVNVIHEHGIVHRDIKGANVFIASNGHLKLGDFGLSFQLQNASRSVMDAIGDNVGTVPYMAPEVIRSGKTHHIGRASDIWSVGCTVVEMITGKTPWSELDNNMRIMFAVGSGSTPQIPDNLSEEGHEFLKFCFEIDPSKRWTASQLLNHAFVKVGQGDLAES